MGRTVYTRETEFNHDSVRWRAPLFLAEFDEKRGCLIRDTEQEVLPLVRTDGIPNAMGNFHAVDISPTQSIVSVGSTTNKVKDGKILNFFSNTLIAKIQWA
ncbi:MAG: hypothetical protein WCS73_02175 [Lentisphaeria bacterium]